MTEKYACQFMYASVCVFVRCVWRMVIVSISDVVDGVWVTMIQGKKAILASRQSACDTFEKFIWWRIKTIDKVQARWERWKKTAKRNLFKWRERLRQIKNALETCHTKLDLFLCFCRIDSVSRWVFQMAQKLNESSECLLSCQLEHTFLSGEDDLSPSQNMSNQFR